MYCIIMFLDSVSYLSLPCSTLRQSTRRCRPCPLRTITSTTSWPAPSRPWQRQSQPYRRWRQGSPNRWPLRPREGELLLGHVGWLTLYEHIYVYNSVSVCVHVHHDQFCICLITFSVPIIYSQYTYIVCLLILSIPKV